MLPWLYWNLLCRLIWPWIHRDPSALLMGLKAYDTMPGFIFLLIFKLSLCGSICAKTHVWRPEDNFLDLVPHLYLYVGSGVELSSLGLSGRYPHMPHHLACPYVWSFVLLDWVVGISLRIFRYIFIRNSGMQFSFCVVAVSLSDFTVRLTLVGEDEFAKVPLFRKN